MRKLTPIRITIECCDMHYAPVAFSRASGRETEAFFAQFPAGTKVPLEAAYVVFLPKANGDLKVSAWGSARNIFLRAEPAQTIISPRTKVPI